MKRDCSGRTIVAHIVCRIDARDDPDGKDDKPIHHSIGNQSGCDLSPAADKICLCLGSAASACYMQSDYMTCDSCVIYPPQLPKYVLPWTCRYGLIYALKHT